MTALLATAAGVIAGLVVLRILWHRAVRADRIRHQHVSKSDVCDPDEWLAQFDNDLPERCPWCTPRNGVLDSDLCTCKSPCAAGYCKAAEVSRG